MATAEEQRKALANNIERIREGSGRTKSYLYKSLGIHQVTFDRKLSGESEFKVSELIRLASALGVTVSELTEVDEDNEDDDENGKAA
jgi:transcriptional regulator with XRE-family HTH domain